jgi:large subunit ribosomal protein L20
MSRVKRGTTKNKKRINVLKQTKGYRFGRSTKEAQAKEAINKAGSHAFAHRKDKKNDFRKLWNIKISAESLKEGLSYSKLISLLKEKDIQLDRKILADLAENNPETFVRVVSKLK